jgi:hypothetical protein
MIIDGELTVGGSFNYSKNAATRNRENVTSSAAPKLPLPLPPTGKRGARSASISTKW